MRTSGFHMLIYISTGSWVQVGPGTVEESAEYVQDTYLFQCRVESIQSSALSLSVKGGD